MMDESRREVPPELARPQEIRRRRGFVRRVLAIVTALAMVSGSVLTGIAIVFGR